MKNNTSTAGAARDWVQDQNHLTSHQDISGKTDKTAKIIAGTGLTGGGN